MINLVKFTEFNNQLIIELTEEGKEELENIIELNLSVQEALEILFESYTNNGYTWVEPEEIGALTNSPIISNDFEYIDDNSDLKFYYSVYWFPDYMIKNEIEELQNGKLIFEKKTI